MNRILPLLLCLVFTSCVGITIGSEEDHLRNRGLLNVHASFDGMSNWSGPFFQLGLFTSEGGRDELLSFQVGPLVSAGVGLVGARAQVLPLEIGVGSMFYNPRPRPAAAQHVEVTGEGEGEIDETVEEEEPEKQESEEGRIH